VTRPLNERQRSVWRTPVHVPGHCVCAKQRKRARRAVGLRVRLLRHTGFERYCPPTRASSRVHRACADGRASTRHLHGITERAARCDTVKVPAESAGAVAR